MSRIISGAEQPLFLAGDGEEHDRPLGSRPVRERARLFDELGHAGAVVDCTVVDAIAGRIGLADAEMIPVRRVDYRLVGVFSAGEEPHNIVAGDHLGVGGVMRVERGLERDRAEIRTPRRHFGLLKSEAGALE